MRASAPDDCADLQASETPRVVRPASRLLSLLACCITAPALASSTATPVLAPLWQQALGSTVRCGFEPVPDAENTVQFDAVGNIYVATSDFLASVAPDGTERWRIDGCPSCTGPSESGGLNRFVVRPDGEVWAVELRYTGDDHWQHVPMALHRIATDGSIVQTHSLTGTAFEQNGVPVLNATTDGVLLATTNLTTLSVLRATPAWVWNEALPLPSNRTYTRLVGSHSFPDDDLLLAVHGSDGIICFPGFWPCGPSDQLGLVRMTQTNDVVWRRDIDTFHQFAAFDRDGSVFFLGDGGWLNHVSADGIMAAPQQVEHLGDAGVYQLTPPVRNRLLISSHLGLQGIDRAGTEHGRVGVDEDPYAFPWDPWNIAVGDAGFLVPIAGDPACHNAVLYEPLRLDERFRFHFPALECVTAPNEAGWIPTPSIRGALHTDGSVALLRLECEAGQNGPVLARFALPGTPAGGLLFRDGFDP